MKTIKAYAVVSKDSTVGYGGILYKHIGGPVSVLSIWKEFEDAARECGLDNVNYIVIPVDVSPSNQ